MSTTGSAAFYRTFAILPFVVALAFIRFFYPNATGWVWDILVYIVVGWALGLLVFWVLRMVRERKG